MKKIFTITIIQLSMLQQLTSSMKNRLQELSRKAYYKRKRIPEDDGNNYEGKSKDMFSNRI
jgi:hypothetical protein